LEVDLSLPSLEQVFALGFVAFSESQKLHLAGGNQPGTENESGVSFPEFHSPEGVVDKTGIPLSTLKQLK
jgi:hypothetical protein